MSHWINQALLSGNALTLMPVLLDAAVKGIVLTAIAYMAVRLMWRASAAHRHVVLLLAMFSLLALPVLSAMLPQWKILPNWFGTPEKVANVMVERAEPAAAPVTPTVRPSVESVPYTSDPTTDAGPMLNPVAPAHAEVSPAPAPEPEQKWSPRELLAWVIPVWLLGTLAALSPLILGTLVLWKRSRKAVRVTGGRSASLLKELSASLRLRHPVTLLRVGEHAMPLAWGILHPKIMLPGETDAWPEARLRGVLIHELAHIKHRDCLAQFVSHVACALHWFNPFAWMIRRRMVLEREQACDDIVLNAGLKSSTYAQQLLEIAAGPRAGWMTGAAAIAMARASSLEGRLLAILDSKRSRRALTRVTVLVGLVLTIAIAIPLATLRTQGAPDLESLGIGTGEEREDAVAALTTRLEKHNLRPEERSQAIAELVRVLKEWRNETGKVYAEELALAWKLALSDESAAEDRVALLRGLDWLVCTWEAKGNHEFRLAGPRASDAPIGLAALHESRVLAIDDKPLSVHGLDVVVTSNNTAGISWGFKRALPLPVTPVGSLTVEVKTTWFQLPVELARDRQLVAYRAEDIDAFRELVTSADVKELSATTRSFTLVRSNKSDTHFRPVQDSLGWHDVDEAGFADAVAKRFVTALRSQGFSFLDQSRFLEIRKEIRDLVARTPQPCMTPERRKNLLLAIGPYVSSYFPQPKNVRQRNDAYLEFPDRLKTFEWKLWLALQRELLSSEARDKLAAQLDWMTRHIESLPKKGSSHTHAEVLAKFDTIRNDPLCPLFHEPFTSAQFEEFKKTVTSDRVEDELAHVLFHLVVAGLDATLRNGEDCAFPFDDKPGMSGVSNCRVTLYFNSNRAFRGTLFSIGDIEKAGRICSLGGGRVLFQGDVKETGAFRQWLNMQDRGDFFFDDAKGGALVGVRGAKLAVLDVPDWIAADLVSAAELRNLIEEKGEEVLSLRDATARYRADRVAFRQSGELYVAILAGDGQLGVVQITDFESDAIRGRVRKRPDESREADGGWTEALDALAELGQMDPLQRADFTSLVFQRMRRAEEAVMRASPDVTREENGGLIQEARTPEEWRRIETPIRRAQERYLELIRETVLPQLAVMIENPPESWSGRDSVISTVRMLWNRLPPLRIEVLTEDLQREIDAQLQPEILAVWQRSLSLLPETEDGRKACTAYEKEIAARSQRLGLTPLDLETYWQRVKQTAEQLRTSPPAEKSAETSWGEAVKGVQVRLRADRATWKAGEEPTFTADVWNHGTQDLYIHGNSRGNLVDWEFEFDGVWHRWAWQSGMAGKNLLRKDQRYDDTAIKFGLWQRKDAFVKPGAKLGTVMLESPPKPGKHTIRVAFTAVSEDRTDIVRVISNPVEITIAPAPRETFLGLDLTDAPRTTKAEDLPDLWEERPPGSKSYELRNGIVVGRHLEHFTLGAVYYLPSKDVFYVQHDPMYSSTLTFYGPFDGKPWKRLGIPESETTTIGAPTNMGEEESGPTSKARYHVIQKGDSLTKISERYYGTKNSWRDIYAANEEVMSRPDRLQPGMKLRIPVLPASTPVTSPTEKKEQTRTVSLPDVDDSAEMLDLATGALIPLPSEEEYENPEGLLDLIKDMGKGDLVYDGPTLVVVRGASARGATQNPAVPVRNLRVEEPLPYRTTITTAEGRRFVVTVEKADKEGCEIRWHDAAESSGGKDSTEVKKDESLPAALAELDRKIRGSLERGQWTAASRRQVADTWQAYIASFLENERPTNRHELAGKLPYVRNYDEYLGTYAWADEERSKEMIEVVKDAEGRFIVKLEGHDIPALASNRSIFFTTGDVVVASADSPRNSDPVDVALECFYISRIDGEYCVFCLGVRELGDTPEKIWRKLVKVSAGNPVQTVAVFISAAKVEDAKAAEVCYRPWWRPEPGVARDVEEFSQVAEVNPKGDIRPASAYLAENKALVVSNAIHGDPKRKEELAVLMFSLEKWTDDDRSGWGIMDIDLEPLEKHHSEINRFLAKNPDAEQWIESPRAASLSGMPNGDAIKFVGLNESDFDAELEKYKVEIPILPEDSTDFATHLVKCRIEIPETSEPETEPEGPRVLVELRDMVIRNRYMFPEINYKPMTVLSAKETGDLIERASRRGTTRHPTNGASTYLLLIPGRPGVCAYDSKDRLVWKHAATDGFVLPRTCTLSSALGGMHFDAEAFLKGNGIFFKRLIYRAVKDDQNWYETWTFARDEKGQSPKMVEGVAGDFSSTVYTAALEEPENLRLTSGQSVILSYKVSPGYRSSRLRGQYGETNFRQGQDEYEKQDGQLAARMFLVTVSVLEQPKE